MYQCAKILIYDHYQLRELELPLYSDLMLRIRRSLVTWFVAPLLKYQLYSGIPSLSPAYVTLGCCWLSFLGTNSSSCLSKHSPTMLPALKYILHVPLGSKLVLLSLFLPLLFSLMFLWWLKILIQLNRLCPMSKQLKHQSNTTRTIFNSTLILITYK